MRQLAPLSYYTSSEMPIPRYTDVFLLAGGKGTRLRVSSAPELSQNPKLLVSVDTRGRREPMLDAAMRGLIEQGFTRINVLTSGVPAANGEAIELRAIKEFRHLPELRMFREHQSLGTAGAVYAALQHVASSPAIVVPGDTAFPYATLVSGLIRHASGDAAITWFVTTDPGPSAQNQGRLLIDEEKMLLLDSAEDSSSDIDKHLRAGRCRATSAGVVIIDSQRFKEIFELSIEAERSTCPVDLHRQVIPFALERKFAVSVFDIHQPAPDLGTPDRLFKFGRTEEDSLPEEVSVGF